MNRSPLPPRRTPLKRSPIRISAAELGLETRKKKSRGSWRTVKRDPVDTLSSRYVRNRDGGACQAPWEWTKRDGGPTSDGRCPRTADHWQIDSAHVFKRRYWGTRYDPNAQFALCKTCHDWSEQHQTEFEAWARKKLGPLYDMLQWFAGTPVHKLGYVNVDELRNEWRIKLKEMLKRQSQRSC